MVFEFGKRNCRNLPSTRKRAEDSTTFHDKIKRKMSSRIFNLTWTRGHKIVNEFRSLHMDISGFGEYFLLHYFTLATLPTTLKSESRIVHIHYTWRCALCLGMSCSAIWTLLLECGTRKGCFVLKILNASKAATVWLTALWEGSDLKGPTQTKGCQTRNFKKKGKGIQVPCIKPKYYIILMAAQQQQKLYKTQRLLQR